MQLKNAKILLSSRKKENSTNLDYFDNLKKYALISSATIKRI